MKANRELPVIKIMGTDFIVDVYRDEFREKGQEWNKISFNHLLYNKTYYNLAYDERIKNVNRGMPWEFRVQIDELIKIDPVGMAEKFNKPLEEAKCMSDFDLRVNQEAWVNRVVKNTLPTIEIAWVCYEVDLRQERLKLKEGNGTDIDLRGLPEIIRGQRNFYFDPGRKEVLSLKSICEHLPHDVVKVSLPADKVLDPVAVAQRECYNLQDFVMKHSINQGLKAKTIPIKSADLLNELELNKKRLLLKSFEDPLLKKNRNSNGKDKGRYL